jgi:hypothetical protein
MRLSKRTKRGSDRGLGDAHLLPMHGRAVDDLDSADARGRIVVKAAAATRTKARLRNRTENFLITNWWFAGDLASLQASEVL